ncbi:MAG: HEAT repeat domain-containing protein [Anaerolineae bacterium]|nr:HEAT repeat domain-containing protein [Anaerolineae bacterium]NUQ04808.1 HEAT repeat domain-containing protein [Anaerolineae bacterium]
MTSSGHAFISYRSSERDFALKLASDLRNTGIPIWMDVLDNGLKVGDDWAQGLQEAIDTASALIALLSPEYLISKYCRRELQRADSRSIPVFPVLLKPLHEASDWPIEIQEKQFISFANWKDQAFYEEQLGILKRTIQDRLPLVHLSTPAPEVQYLNSLIAELEGLRGVVEYVEPQSEIEAPLRRSNTTGWDASFHIVATPQQGEPIALQSSESASLSEVGKRFDKFVLIGAPGTGKTTALRRFSYEAALKRSTDANSPLPLLLHLSQWDTNVPITDFIRSKWQFPYNPIPLLREGRILLLLDGLNEMGTNAAANLQNLRAWFASAEAPKYVIVACRADRYSEELGLADFPVVRLNLLEVEQIQQIATNYLSAEQAAAFLEQIMPPALERDIYLLSTQYAKYFEEQNYSRSLLKLARIPYFLASLLYLFIETSGNLPRSPGTIFQVLAQRVYERERLRNPQTTVSWERLSEQLARLAFTMFEQGWSTEIPLRFVSGKLMNDPEMRFAVEMNILMRGRDRISFTHQLLQEYFAALEVKRRGLAAVLKAPVYKNDVNLCSERKRGTWDSVVLMVFGSAEDNVYLKSLLTIDPILAATCISEASARINENVYTELVRTLVDAVRSKSILRASAITALGTLDDPNMSPVLIECLHDDNTSIQSLAARALGRLKSREAVPALSGLLTSADGSTAGLTALKAIRQIGDHSAVPVVCKALESKGFTSQPMRLEAIHTLGEWGAREGVTMGVWNDEPAVRYEAARWLGRLGLTQASDFPPLEWLLYDSHTVYRSHIRVYEGALEALSQSPLPHASDLLARWLDGWVQRLNARNGWETRYRAAQELGYIGQKSVIPHLIAVLTDADSGIRSAAVQALGHLKDPVVEDALIALLRDDGIDQRHSRGRVCDYAAEALEEIGTDRAINAAVHFYASELENTTYIRMASRPVYQLATEALARIKTPEAVKVLIPHLIRELDHTEEYSFERRCDTAARLLVEFSSAEARAAVKAWAVREVESPDKIARLNGASRLIDLGDQQSVEKVLINLGSAKFMRQDVSVLCFPYVVARTSMLREQMERARYHANPVVRHYAEQFLAAAQRLELANQFDSARMSPSLAASFVKLYPRLLPQLIWWWLRRKS